MQSYERDPYTEAHAKGPGCLFFCVWVTATIAGTVGGLALGSFIQPETGQEGIAADFVQTLVIGAILGITTGLAQALVLARYLKLHGMAEWLAATLVGRVARGAVMFAAIQLAAGIDISIDVAVVMCIWLLVQVGTGAAGGLVLGFAQSFVLGRRVAHSRWWVLAVLPASAVNTVIAGLVDWMGPYSGLVTGAIGGIMTGYVLVDLLRHPTVGAEWGLSLRDERRSRAGIDPGTQP